MLNDLILASNQALPEAQRMETWSLFSVTPIGIVMVIAGISYFVIAGRFVLPSIDADGSKKPDTLKYFQDV